MADWADHLTTIFPEVRLKKFLEMRGADGGSWRRICGLPALWVGLYYDQAALDAAWDMVKDWSAEERQAMRDAVPVLAFKTPFRGRNVGDLAREMLAISSAGLRRRASEDSIGATEEGFLQPLIELVAVPPTSPMASGGSGFGVSPVTRLFETCAPPIGWPETVIPSPWAKTPPVAIA